MGVIITGTKPPPTFTRNKTDLPAPSDPLTNATTTITDRFKHLFMLAMNDVF
jgi:hypothetical protein